MAQINSNTEWLFRNTPRAQYSLPSGIRKDTGIRIASGLIMFPPKKSDNDSAAVRFGGYFSALSEPIITTGIYSNSQRKIFAVVSGLNSLKPDHTGFRAMVNIAASLDKNDKITNTIYVSWQALGY